MSAMMKAFVAAQKAFGPALKTASNPHFRSKYAALDGCVEAVIDGLHANGFALMWRTEPNDSGVQVECILAHESGECVKSGWLYVPAAKRDPQGFGSALTYARRYTLMSVCGIAPEDDDGNAATSAVHRQRQQPAAAPTADKDTYERRLACANSIDELKAEWGKVPPAMQKLLVDVKDATRNKLLAKSAGVNDDLLNGMNRG